MTLIKEIMTQSLELIEAQKTLDEAAILMRDADIGALPVVSNGEVQGIITDRDIAVRAVAERKDPSSTRVDEVMTRDVIYCFEDQDLREAADQMERNQVRRLLVFDRNDNCCGIVSQADVALRSRDPNLVNEVVEKISEPEHREPRH